MEAGSYLFTGAPARFIPEKQRETCRDLSESEKYFKNKDPPMFLIKA